jgi:hypothetical protein
MNCGAFAVLIEVAVGGAWLGFWRWRRHRDSLPQMPTKWRPVTLTSVDDLVAEDWWEYRKLGRKIVSRIAVGKPAPDPSGRDWYCPLLFENELEGWKAIYGVGPVDALMNALAFVRSHFDALRPMPLGGRARGKNSAGPRGKSKKRHAAR